MIVCQRVVCWRVRTSRALQSMVALAGSRRSRVMIRQFLRSLKPCSTGARAADRAWLACRWAGVVLRAEVDFQPVMMTGSSGSGSRPVKPRSARAPSPAAHSRTVRWSWRVAVISLAAPRRAEEIQIRLPAWSVRARNSSPCFLCLSIR